METNEFDLKKFREALNLTQRELAEKIGISQSTLNGWEKNPKSITLSSMMQIANTLGFKIDDLLDYEDKIIIKNNFNFESEAIKYHEDTNKNILDFRNYIDNLDPIDDIKYQLQTIAKSADYQNRKLNLALFGKSDAGKSTLINSLIGEDVSPTQWSAATRSVIKFIHVDDKPKKFKDVDTVVVATSITEDSVNVSKLYDENFIDINLKAVGDRSLITKYGVHNKELELEEDMIYTIFSFVDSDILKGINVIDTPGTSTGQHKKGTSDVNASENTRSEADLVIYASPINQFLQNEDQIYLKTLIDYLPMNMDALTNRPFSNLWIVATQAQIIDDALNELHKEEGIIEKSLENFTNTLPKDYFSIKGKNYTVNSLKERFFSYSRDSKSLTADFKEDFINSISDYIKLASDNSLKFLKISVEEVIKMNSYKVIEYNNNAKDINRVKQELDEKIKYRETEFQKIDNLFKQSIERTELFSLKSKQEFTEEINKIMTPEYITELINEKDFKNNKKDKEALFSLINNTISVKFDEINEKYSMEFSKLLAQDIDKFSHNFNSFDFKRSFISLLSGGLASGALIAYMGTLGNLGGYILVTQSVGVLASMGISVGGGAAATSAVAAIGGPVTIAVGLGVLLTMSVFAVSGIGWKKSLAKKIIKSFEKEKALEQYTEAIKTYWKNTSISLEQNSLALKEKYDIEIKNLEIETQKNPEYFIKKAKQIEFMNNRLLEYFV